MTVGEAAAILRGMYDGGAADRSQATQVHLFGIRYAAELAGMPLVEIAVRAGISKAYHTEIRKGMKLARYVTLRGAE